MECEFAALRYFALNGISHRGHGEEDDAIGTYVCWRNQRAKPIRVFAVGSEIRRPDYICSLLDAAQAQAMKSDFRHTEHDDGYTHPIV
ncbi:hypothetical protein [Nocardia farcinica]|uniref:hypothetical protein n=1 Tax=Nocardia farcinica TaxID=37329 RepID=UPI001E4592FE|nr:hypothetical protein [Nocardia farcinica]